MVFVTCFMIKFTQICIDCHCEKSITFSSIIQVVFEKNSNFTFFNFGVFSSFIFEFVELITQTLYITTSDAFSKAQKNNNIFRALFSSYIFNVFIIEVVKVSLKRILSSMIDHHYKVWSRYQLIFITIENLFGTHNTDIKKKCTN